MAAARRDGGHSCTSGRNLDAFTSVVRRVCVTVGSPAVHSLVKRERRIGHRRSRDPVHSLVITRIIWVTTDIDTVNRRAGHERGQIEMLLAGGATAIDGAGVIISTRAGDIRVDTLEISAAQIDSLPPDPTDRRYLLAHDCALRTATKLCTRPADNTERISEATALVAEPRH